MKVWQWMRRPARRTRGNVISYGELTVAEPRDTSPVPDGPMFVWASFGGPDSPPEQVRVESCLDCAALVPAETFDVHGRWHAARRRDAHR